MYQSFNTFDSKDIAQVEVFSKLGQSSRYQVQKVTNVGTIEKVYS
jgi:hypothetical protein